MSDKQGYVPGDVFHTQVNRVYSGPYGWAVNKKNAQMARVVYDPAHENLAESDPEKCGKGKDYATWVMSEEPGCAENVLTTGLELVIDATLEPHASIGLHMHGHTEEVYYILAGSVTMTTISREGDTHTEELLPGDAHVVKLGQGHYGTAGTEGVRFIAIATRKPTAHA